MRRIPMNTNLPSDHIEQNFRFLFPIESLELNLLLNDRIQDHNSTKKGERERERKKMELFKIGD